MPPTGYICMNKWEKRYSELKEFADTNNGDCLIKKSHTIHSERLKKLHEWCSNQRVRKRAKDAGKHTGKNGLPGMTEEQFQKLTAIGFKWEVQLEQWEERFRELQLYKFQIGNCDVPLSFDNKELANFVALQRKRKKAMDEGKVKKGMTREQFEKLDNLGFTWEFYTPLDWETRFQELQLYKEQYGNCNVTTSFGNKELYLFVLNQRKKKKEMDAGKEGMTKEQFQRLDNLGFRWEVVSRVAWETRLIQLCQYWYEFDHMDVPARYPTNQPLANWVRRQRQQMKLLDEGFPSLMTAERIKELNAVGFKWVYENGSGGGRGGWWKTEIRRQLIPIWKTIDEKHKKIDIDDAAIEKNRNKPKRFSRENPFAWTGNPFKELVLVIGKAWSDKYSNDGPPLKPNLPAIVEWVYDRYGIEFRTIKTKKKKTKWMASIFKIFVSNQVFPQICNDYTSSFKIWFKIEILSENTIKRRKEIWNL
mmetsp:Transcript_39356/g.95243  ORF Transcript_39356/g.95243 Transcript_39356/m.95243 type:complete len:476 (+) Transcript_39356:98-1525(+)